MTKFCLYCNLTKNSRLLKQHRIVSHGVICEFLEQKKLVHNFFSWSFVSLFRVASHIFRLCVWVWMSVYLFLFMPNARISTKFMPSHFYTTAFLRFVIRFFFFFDFEIYSHENMCCCIHWIVQSKHTHAVMIYAKLLLVLLSLSCSLDSTNLVLSRSLFPSCFRFVLFSFFFQRPIKTKLSNFFFLLDKVINLDWF